MSPPWCLDPARDLAIPNPERPTRAPPGIARATDCQACDSATQERITRRCSLALPRLPPQRLRIYGPKPPALSTELRARASRSNGADLDEALCHGARWMG